MDALLASLIKKAFDLMGTMFVPMDTSSLLKEERGLEE